MRLEPLVPVLVLVLGLAGCSPPAPPANQEIDTPAESEEAPVLEADRAPSKPAAKRQAAASQAPGGYQYIDESGRVRVAASLDEVPERQRSTATALAARREREAHAGGSDEPVNVNRADVTIYTSPGCGWCRKAMAYFDQKGVDYTNRDVTSDAEAYADYNEVTGGNPGVPVIVVGEDMMQGWNQGRFDEMLASAH